MWCHAVLGPHKHWHPSKFNLVMHVSVCWYLQDKALLWEFLQWYQFKNNLYLHEIMWQIMHRILHISQFWVKLYSWYQKYLDTIILLFHHIHNVFILFMFIWYVYYIIRLSLSQLNLIMFHNRQVHHFCRNIISGVMPDFCRIYIFLVCSNVCCRSSLTWLN